MMKDQDNISRVVGGEYEFADDGLFSALLDSGRSSLRLILEALGKRRKYLLPDFLCPVILDIFDEKGIERSFYKIKEDLSVDLSSLPAIDENTVVYIIDYFGARDAVMGMLAASEAFILEDAVFLPIFCRPEGISKWAGFNSFRKISFLADGSLAKSSVPLDERLIKGGEAPFSAPRYEAKKIKYEYVSGTGREMKGYLDLDEKCKRLIRDQKKIFRISGKSSARLVDLFSGYQEEKKIRLRNMGIIRNEMGDAAVAIDPEFPSFQPLLLERRDEVRQKLFVDNIFLPVHWPGDPRVFNNISSRIISVPVDSRYSAGDMKRICDLMNKYITGR